MAVGASKIAFYAADAGDYARAIAAAQKLGVPLANVTGDFSTAATWVYHGTYLVIAVGGQADAALYFNGCNWSQTAYSGYPSCETPFYYYSSNPYDGPIGALQYVSANGSNAFDSLILALSEGGYAANGDYPANMFLPQPTANNQTAATCHCAGQATNRCPTSS